MQLLKKRWRERENIGSGEGREYQREHQNENSGEVEREGEYHDWRRREYKERRGTHRGIITGSIIRMQTLKEKGKGERGWWNANSLWKWKHQIANSKHRM